MYQAEGHGLPISTLENSPQICIKPGIRVKLEGHPVKLEGHVTQVMYYSEGHPPPMAFQLDRSCVHMLDPKPMANLHQKARCHPDRLHVAHGLCQPCYSTNYNTLNAERLKLKQRNYAKAVRLGIRKRRPAPCHPDRPHFALDLCERCYHKTPHAKALRKARNKVKPVELRPVQRLALEDARKAKPLFAPTQLGASRTAASFFAKRGAK